MKKHAAERWRVYYISIHSLSQCKVTPTWGKVILFDCYQAELRQQQPPIPLVYDILEQSSTQEFANDQAHRLLTN